MDCESKDRITWKLIVGIVVLFAFAQVSWGQTSSAKESKSASTDPQEEIVVVGEKRLGTLRREFNTAQEAFFAKFNDLNSDDKFDFECDVVVDLATRRRQHVCKPNFAKKIEASISRDLVLTGEWWGDASYSGVGRRDQKRMVQEMLDLLQQHPELREAQLAVVEAKQAYQGASEKP